MAKIQIFLDTDVIISSLLSKTGASYSVINNPKIEKIISKTVEKEVKEVSKRLAIDNHYSNITIKKIRKVTLNLTKNELLKKYKDYVFDEKDSHVIGGVHKLNLKILLTHNKRHYKVNKIKNDLGVVVFKPGNFLQYLRSIDEF